MLSGSSVWGDILIKYDGEYNVYDSLGNPTVYNTSDTDLNMTWQKGRQLASIDNGTNTIASYTYDSSGLRTRKVTATQVYDYYWIGDRLTVMTIKNSSGVVTATLKFAYDSAGLPMALDYNNTVYLYVTDLQGNVCGLMNQYGVCAYYQYDAWGNILFTDAAA